MLYFPNSFLQNRNDHWQTPFTDIYFSVRFAPYIVRLNCWIDREYEWFVKIVTTNKQLIQYWDLLGLKLSTTSNLKKLTSSSLISEKVNSLVSAPNFEGLELHPRVSNHVLVDQLLKVAVLDSFFTMSKKDYSTIWSLWTFIGKNDKQRSAIKGQNIIFISSITIKKTLKL